MDLWRSAVRLALLVFAFALLGLAAQVLAAPDASAQVPPTGLDDTTGTVTGTVDDTTGTVTGTVDDTTDQATGTAGDTTDQATGTAREAAGTDPTGSGVDAIVTSTAERSLRAGTTVSDAGLDRVVGATRPTLEAALDVTGTATLAADPLGALTATVREATHLVLETSTAVAGTLDMDITVTSVVRALEPATGPITDPSGLDGMSSRPPPAAERRELDGRTFDAGGRSFASAVAWSDGVTSGSSGEPASGPRGPTAPVATAPLAGSSLLELRHGGSFQDVAAVLAAMLLALGLVRWSRTWSERRLLPVFLSIAEHPG